MGILKALFIAFSLYSSIPVPEFSWKEKEMKYMLCFFPWVGALIGALLFFWRYLCQRYFIGEIAYLFISAAIPLLVTGGFHADGFMDTMDALHSWQPREKKLEILKDSQLGAFSVIMLTAYGLVYLAAFSEIRQQNLFSITCAGFFLSRCLSGLSVVYFPPAKKEGMLYTLASGTQVRPVRWILGAEILLGICFMLKQSLLFGLIITIGLLLLYGYYYHRMKRELGGITGDTAGCFVLLCEGTVVVLAAILNILVHGEL